MLVSLALAVILAEPEPERDPVVESPPPAVEPERETEAEPPPPTAEPEPEADVEPPTPAPEPEPEPEAKRETEAEPSPPAPEAKREAGSSLPPPSSQRVASIGGPTGDESGWRAEFHGYFNAPMRFGIGRRESRLSGQGLGTLHAPIVPDDQYLTWQHTSHTKRSWAELWLGFGNDLAKGVVSVQAWDYSGVGFVDPQAQLGIAQAYVHLTPRFRRSPLRLWAKVGAHNNHHGRAGRYDTGAFETYLFGRTRYIGETVGLDIPLGETTLGLEHGLGVTRALPLIYNAANFTLTAHHHAGVRWRGVVEAGVHHLLAWSGEEERAGDPELDPNPDAPDGTLQIMGPDIRVEGGRFGYWYAGFSYIDARRARVVGPSIEVLHSFGGGFFDLGIVGNYLNGPAAYGPTSEAGAVSAGTGRIYTALLQTEHSLRTMLEGDDFWGEGWDLKLTLYGMINRVVSDADLDIDPDTETRKGLKLKYGGDLLYEALPWLGVAVRYDRLQPSRAVPEHSFSILSPRLVLRSRWITHEAIIVQYSRYFYNVRCDAAGVDPASGSALRCVQPPSAPVLYEGFGAAYDPELLTRGAPLARPDVNLVTVSASIWW